MIEVSVCVCVCVCEIFGKERYQKCLDPTGRARLLDLGTCRESKAQGGKHSFMADRDLLRQAIDHVKSMHGV